MMWYVLFVKTGYEQKVAEEIRRGWRIDNLNPFIPMYDAKFRKAGKVITEKRRIFPGYVFIESQLAGTEFYLATRERVSRSEYALKLLRNSNVYEGDSSFEVNTTERQMFQKLCDKEHCIAISQGVVVGDKVQITQGPLMGYESCVKRINRHKMEALVSINIMGDTRDVTMGLEIIQRV